MASHISMATFKLVLVFCLIAVTCGFETKSRPVEGDVETQPKSENNDFEKGDPKVVDRGDLSEYKQWESPDIKVGQKPPASEQKSKSVGKKQGAPMKAGQSKKTTTTSKKQPPASRKSVSGKQTSKKVPQKKMTKGEETSGSKSSKSAAYRRMQAKKNLLGGPGGKPQQDAEPQSGAQPQPGGDPQNSGPGPMQGGGGSDGATQKSTQEYDDLINPTPTAEFAEHFFTEVAKPMPKSEGCEDEYEGELPKIITPHHYDLAFKFDTKNMKFWGHELIYVEIGVPKLEYFFLHSHELDIAEILYIDAKEQKPIMAQITNVSSKDKKITVTLDTPQETKNGFISIKWKGDVSEALDGIYKTTAINTLDPNNQFEYQAISTQFEPASARKAFPCIDEPAVKATYNQTLITQVENAALANGLEESEEELPEDKFGVKWKKVRFGRTPKMSTFLVAFFAGDFEYVEGHSKNNGVRVRVYAARGKKKDGEYALNEAIESLDYLEKHFEIDFPMPKIDCIAVPDYAQGAMENWGLITFLETMLLIPEGEMLKPKMEACKTIITHELVHQWFGNLVTHRWWEYLWLKEGFAQFMQRYIVDKLKPEWKVMDGFTTTDYITAMNGDASHDSHAIQVKIVDVGDVGEIFDGVSYSKGASLLRWLMDWLGEDTMKEGYKQYLKKNMYGTACSKDLFKALEDVSGKPVEKVMDGWVTKKGFPMVSTMIMKKNSTSITLKMVQRRFSLTSPNLEEKDDMWSFPIKFITSREDEQTGGKAETTRSEFMFDKRSFEVTVPMEGPTSLDWIKVNPGSIGFYLTNYLEPLSYRLIDPIMEQSLGYIDRISLIHEMFQEVLAGERSVIEYLNFVKAYREDPNFVVWQAIDGHISKLTMIASNTNFADSFKVFCHYLYGAIYEKIPSWEAIEGEGSNESGLKALIIKRLGFAGHKDVVEKARKYYDDEMSGKKKMPKTLKGIIYSVVTRRMNDTEVKERIRKFVDEDDEAEKSKIQGSLPHVQDESQIKAVIKLAFSKYIRSMSSLTMLGTLGATSLKARTLVWRFFVQNAEQVKGDPNLGGFLKGLMSGFASKSVLDKMRENINQIVEEHNIEGLTMALKQGYDFGISNYNILLRGGQELSSFLTEFANVYTS